MMKRRLTAVLFLFLLSQGCAPPVERAQKTCDQWLDNLKNDKSYASGPLIVKNLSEMGFLFKIIERGLTEGLAGTGKAGTDLGGHVNDLMNRRFLTAPYLYKDLFGRLQSYRFTGSKEIPGNLVIPSMFEHTYEAQFEKISARLLFQTVETGGQMKIYHLQVELPNRDLQAKMDGIFYGPFVNDMGGYIKEHKGEALQAVQRPDVTVKVNGRELNAEEKKQFVAGADQVLENVADQMRKYDASAATNAKQTPRYIPVTAVTLAPAASPSAQGGLTPDDPIYRILEVRVKYVQSARRYLNRTDLKTYCTPRLQGSIDASPEDFDAGNAEVLREAQRLFNGTYAISRMERAAAPGGMVRVVLKGPQLTCQLTFVENGGEWLLDGGYCGDMMSKRNYGGSGQKPVPTPAVTAQGPAKTEDQ